MDTKKVLTFSLIAVIVIILVIAVFYAFGGWPSFKLPTSEKKVEEKPKIVEENLVIPDTKKITGTEGRFVNDGAVDVKLVPQSEGEKVIVPKAVLTVKGSYDLAAVEAGKWSSDAKLVFIKSLGAVTLEGKSSQWQLAFSAKSKLKKGYEVIIQADQIVSKKEIDSTAVGADLPKNWKDLGEIIKELQTHPFYQDATVSGVNFYLNPDDKNWYYGLATSKGASSIVVK